MGFVSVTRLRVGSPRFLFPVALHILATRRQVRRARGFRGGSLLADRAWTFWTVTAWDSETSMRLYMTAGSHQAAMPYLAGWCDEASVVHWEQSDTTLPSWAEANRHMREHGRASKVRHPSNEHAGLTYRDPRTSIVLPISPAGDALE